MRAGPGRRSEASRPSWMSMGSSQTMWCGSGALRTRPSCAPLIPGTPSTRSARGAPGAAFWRGALALPPLGVGAVLEQRHAAPGARVSAPLAHIWREPGFFWAGVFFAGDLALWHASLLLTAVAASTLEANCAPLVVTLGAWALWGERPRPGFLVSLALSFGGLALIVRPKFGHRADGVNRDLLRLGTSGFD